MAKKILVADDEPHIVRILQDTLVKRGYQVITAADGQEAVETALRERPDLIFLDVMMPQLSGIEVCDQLRNEHQMTVPIFMLTARGQERDLERGKAAGANQYLTKPFSPRGLGDLVDETLGGA
jgi:two-component system alkaline phosphatase synthesis response regulator PhoP